MRTILSLALLSAALLAGEERGTISYRKQVMLDPNYKSRFTKEEIEKILAEAPPRVRVEVRTVEVAVPVERVTRYERVATVCGDGCRDPWPYTACATPFTYVRYYDSCAPRYSYRSWRDCSPRVSYSFRYDCAPRYRAYDCGPRFDRRHSRSGWSFGVGVRYGRSGRCR